MSINTRRGSRNQVSLKNLICDLRVLRGEMLPSELVHRSGILAGQLLILASEYQRGRRPSKSTLRGFLHLVTGEGRKAA